MKKKLNEKKIKDEFYNLFKKSEENFKWKIDLKLLDKRLKTLRKNNQENIDILVKHF